MPPTATLDPTSQSTQLAYNPQGQLSAVTLPAKVGATSIPVISRRMRVRFQLVEKNALKPNQCLRKKLSKE